MQRPSLLVNSLWKILACERKLLSQPFTCYVVTALGHDDVIKCTQFVYLIISSWYLLKSFNGTSVTQSKLILVALIYISFSPYSAVCRRSIGKGYIRILMNYKKKRHPRLKLWQFNSLHGQYIRSVSSKFHHELPSVMGENISMILLNYLQSISII